MQNVIGERVYRKLLFYLENKCLVHFTIKGNGYKNGLVTDLSQSKFTLVLQEYSLELKSLTQNFIPFLCEDIDSDSINPFREEVK